MRTVEVSTLTETVRDMCRPLAMTLPDDVYQALEQARATEDSPVGCAVLDDLLNNASLADEASIPICQDTGVAVVFMDVGREVHFDGDPYAAIEEGVRRGYREFNLRKSVVSDPLRRVNTGDNTPPFVTVRLVPGDRVKVTLMAKGFGSENMSRLIMLRPADGVEGVKRFVLETVEAAGPNACPPFVVGVGIGGTFDRVALLAKMSLMRRVGEPHPDPYYAELEREWLAAINQSGIGPQGFGGRTTALAVHIEKAATHIAGLPVAVNMNCHATRHVERVL